MKQPVSQVEVNILKNQARKDKLANTRIAKRVDVYANTVVNNYILNKAEYGLDYLPTGIYNGLLMLNKDKIDKEYSKIIRNKKTTDSLYYQVQIQRTANNKALHITDEQFNRLKSNINSIERIMRNYELNIDKYKELNKKYPKYASRHGIITESIENLNIIRSQGTNIQPHVFGYRELTPLTEGLHRQTQIEAKHELALAQNENPNNDIDNQYKSWIWTGIGKTTRHETNNMQTVPINEPFIIENSNDGQIDEMMHPLDPNVTSSNGWICYCEVAYHNNSEGYTPESFGDRINLAMDEVNRRLNTISRNLN